MSARDFDNKIGITVKPTERTKMVLVGIQKKIQNLHSHDDNSGFLQELLNEASHLIKLTDKDAGEKIWEYSFELNFYLKGGEDDLVKFYRCKAETLTIIAKQIGL